MNILVCLKQVPDYDMVVSDNWVVKNNSVDIEYANRVINCFDEVSLELALRLSEKLDSLSNICNISVISVGSSQKDATLKMVLPYNIENVTRIDYKDNASPLQIAYLIKEYIKMTSMPDVILAGCQAGNYDNAQTPYYIAELLNIRCLTNVTDFHYKETLIATHTTHFGHQQTKIIEPHVLSVCSSDEIMLRSCTLKEKLAAKQRNIKVVSNLEAKDLRALYPDKLLTIDKQVNCSFEHLDAQAAAKMLYEQINQCLGEDNE